MSNAGHNGGFAGAMITAPLAKTSAQPDQSRAFEPNSIDEAYRLAKILVASRLLPDGANTPEAAFAIIATGRELGMTAMQSLRSIYVIKGKPTLSADLVCALVKSRRDVCAFFQLVESTPERAVYKTQRIGEPEPTSMTYTFDDAKRAQVTGNPNWTKHPAAMLRARCITALARAVFPDLVLGIYDPDELEAVAVPEDRRVYVEPAPLAPQVPVGVELFADICNHTDAAESPSQLNGVARLAQKAHREGLLTDAQLDQIKVAVSTKRKLFAPVEAPPSEPKVDPSTGEVTS